jgi:hypothetical protein
MLFADYADANGDDHVVLAMDPAAAGLSAGESFDDIFAQSGMPRALSTVGCRKSEPSATIPKAAIISTAPGMSRIWLSSLTLGCCR